MGEVGADDGRERAHQPAGRRGAGAGDREGLELAAAYIDAEEGGAHRIEPHGAERAAKAGMGDPPEHGDEQGGHEDDEDVVGLALGEVDRADPGPRDAGQTVIAAEERGFRNDDVDEFREGEGQDGEIDALGPPERHEPDQRRDGRANGGGGGKRQEERHLRHAQQQKGHRIGPCRREGRLAEAQEARGREEEVEGEAQHHIDGHDAGEEDQTAIGDERQEKGDAGQQGEDEEEA